MLSNNVNLSVTLASAGVFCVVRRFEGNNISSQKPRTRE